MTRAGYFLDKCSSLKNNSEDTLISVFETSPMGFKWIYFKLLFSQLLKE